MKENFEAFLALVWPEDGDFDSPKQGYHVTPGDDGGGTYGGVIEDTWDHYVNVGVVSGALVNASEDQLKIVLRAEAWGSIGDILPSGIDILVANGKMMTGRYQAIVEQCLGKIGADVDNSIGPKDLAAIAASDPRTLLFALHGNHYAYLSRLPSWSEFKGGWTRRLVATLNVAEALVSPPPTA